MLQKEVITWGVLRSFNSDKLVRMLNIEGKKPQVNFKFKDVAYSIIPNERIIEMNTLLAENAALQKKLKVIQDLTNL